MKARVENVVERGKVGDEYITNQQQREAFNKWNSQGFTRQDHPTVIQVNLLSNFTVPFISKFFLMFCFDLKFIK